MIGDEGMSQTIGPGQEPYGHRPPTDLGAAVCEARASWLADANGGAAAAHVRGRRMADQIARTRHADAYSDIAPVVAADPTTPSTVLTEAFAALDLPQQFCSPRPSRATRPGRRSLSRNLHRDRRAARARRPLPVANRDRGRLDRQPHPVHTFRSAAN